MHTEWLLQFYTCYLQWRLLELGVVRLDSHEKCVSVSECVMCRHHSNPPQSEHKTQVSYLPQRHQTWTLNTFLYDVWLKPVCNQESMRQTYMEKKSWKLSQIKRLNKKTHTLHIYKRAISLQIWFPEESMLVTSFSPTKCLLFSLSAAKCETVWDNPLGKREADPNTQTLKDSNQRLISRVLWQRIAFCLSVSNKRQFC